MAPVRQAVCTLLLSVFVSASLTQHSAVWLVYDCQTLLNIKYHMEDRLNVELYEPVVNHHLCPTHLCPVLCRNLHPCQIMHPLVKIATWLPNPNPTPNPNPSPTSMPKPNNTRGCIIWQGVEFGMTPAPEDASQKTRKTRWSAGWGEIAFGVARVGLSSLSIHGSTTGRPQSYLLPLVRTSIPMCYTCCSGLQRRGATAPDSRFSKTRCEFA